MQLHTFCSWVVRACILRCLARAIMLLYSCASSMVASNMTCMAAQTTSIAQLALCSSVIQHCAVQVCGCVTA